MVRKIKNDKSIFLEKLGYNKENDTILIEDIKKLATENDAVLSSTNDFGDLYYVIGALRNKVVITIWLEELPDNTFRFVTLFPV